MSDAFDDEGQGGTSGEHPYEPGARRLPIAPSVPNASNVLRLPLTPIACWRLSQTRFDFDSSFVKPAARAEFRSLVATARKHEGAPMAVFAHADPTGDDEYNKKLSGRRARAIYGVLTRDPSLWEDLYKQPLGHDDWKYRAVQQMLAAVTDAQGEAYFTAPITGHVDAPSMEAARRFQTDQGLAVDGDVGPNTRAKLFAAYMDWLCADDDGAPVAFAPADFLGGGAGPDGKGAVQGCGEFNPVLVFASEDQARFARAGDKTERDAHNAPNRRVLVYWFPKATALSAGQWPCPTSKEPGAGCKAQFWADGDARRSPRGDERQYGQSRDTMACRLYDGFARFSPCEGVTSRFKNIALRLFDAKRNVMANAPCRVTVGRAGLAPERVQMARSNGDGFVIVRSVEIPNNCTVEWQPSAPGTKKPGGSGFDYTHTVYLNFDDGPKEEQAARRLHNLGFPDTDGFEKNVRAFQRLKGLEASGVLDGPTEAELWRAHREYDA